MQATLFSDIIAETYIDVEKLVYHTVHKFSKRYEILDFDDYLSEANFAFIKAMKNYNKSKGAISTWVQTKIWFALLEKRRNVSKDWLEPVETLPEKTINPGENRITDLLSDLSNDARFVAGLILDSPEDLAVNLIKSGNKPKNRKATLKRYLSKMGWNCAKIQKCFEEVRQAIEA